MADEDKKELDFPTTPIEPELGVEDDAVIDLVRGTRLSILREQTRHGVPVDADSWSMMHQNLQELERGALAKKRLAQEDKSSAAQIDLANNMAAAIIAGMGNGRDVYAVDGAVGEIPNPLKDIEGAATLVPGELKIGDDTGKYDDFNATVGKKFDDARRAKAAELGLDPDAV